MYWFDAICSAVQTAIIRVGEVVLSELEASPVKGCCQNERSNWNQSWFLNQYTSYILKPFSKVSSAKIQIYSIIMPWLSFPSASFIHGIDLDLIYFSVQHLHIYVDWVHEILVYQTFRRASLTFSNFHKHGSVTVLVENFLINTKFWFVEIKSLANLHAGTLCNIDKMKKSNVQLYWKMLLRHLPNSLVRKSFPVNQ